MRHLLALVKKYEQLCRYLIAGSFVFAVNLFALYVCTEVFGIHYIVSTVVAFLIAFVVSFILQKFWTFKDHSRDHLHIQIPLFLGMQVINISLNTTLMYVFVEYMHVWYLLSQAIISIGLAIIIFFVNKTYIFKTRTISM